MDLVGIFSESFWYVAPILATITVAVAGFFNNLLKVKKAIWQQVTAWVVAAILSVCAWLFGFINFGVPEWAGVVVLAAVVGLSSNGIYDIPSIKQAVSSIFGAFGKKDETPKVEE